VVYAAPATGWQPRGSFLCPYKNPKGKPSCAPPRAHCMLYKYKYKYQHLSQEMRPNALRVHGYHGSFQGRCHGSCCTHVQ
jgi:hypothetical protein